MVVKGYWNDPEATANNFVAGFWRSGDIGSLDEEGYLRVLDRKKDMINRGGYKIYSIEVENVLMTHPAVLEAAVIGMPCPVLGERAHAVRVLAGWAHDVGGPRNALPPASCRLQGPRFLQHRSRPAAAQRERKDHEA